jgi:hypothetical protein
MEGIIRALGVCLPVWGLCLYLAPRTTVTLFLVGCVAVAAAGLWSRWTEVRT